jgi:hypothetical protein
MTTTPEVRLNSMRRLLPVWLMGLGNATFFVMPQLLAEAHVPEPKIAIITVRYHFGDDPAWANPNFDDSAWPVAQDAILEEDRQILFKRGVADENLRRHGFNLTAECG